MSANSIKELPVYQSHKKVRALEIVKVFTSSDNGAVTLSFPDDYPDKNVNREVIQRYRPQPGDYYVQYADGYESISPRKAFLEGYTLADVSETVAPPTGPNFDRNTVISTRSLVVDRYGKSWWVWPESMSIVPAAVRE